MLSANPRYISSMLLILILRFFSVKVLLHGQGLYKKDKVGFLNKITYTYFNFFCDKYICYSKTSMESLAKLAIMKKSIVCENSLINYCGVERKYSGENGVLFVGRLRNESNINFLIQLAQYNPKLQIHIVGSSGLINEFKEISNKLKNIIFYGEIYEFEKISEISKNCFIGVYPGDAGLSVVHYMSLSLPVLVHDDLKKHMGPEPSYVKNNFNGLLFKRGDFISFANGINKFFEMDVTEKNLFMENSYNTYKDLVNPSLANRFLDCFYEVSNGKN
jgi:glycosyltransferase involved in cell wall biosynthesis